MEPTRYGRAILTSLSVAAASSALALVAVKEIDDGIDPLRRLDADRDARGGRRPADPREPGPRHARAARRPGSARAEGGRTRGHRQGAGRLRRANETLRESEERLRTVFEAAIDGIVELDHQNVILRSNEAFCKMIDLSVARRGATLERARGVDRGGRQLRRAPRHRTHRAGDAPSRGALDLPRVSHVADPRRPAPPAAARARRHGGARGRPDDPLALQVPPGPRRGPDADHAADERGDRERAQPDRTRPARRTGAGRVGGLALPGGRPPDAEGR